MAITQRMGQIYQDYVDGVSVDVLAVRYQISRGSALKKIQKVESALQPNTTEVAATKTTTIAKVIGKKWNNDNIREGIERFISEQGRPPTAKDFDDAPYLPSARQIQRVYGGLVALRESLGFKDIDFTKGDLRKAIAARAGQRGITAENYLEPLLIAKFGEPYVHVQKRYHLGSRCRYDFLIYAKDTVFGIDTFTTDRAEYIDKNLRHKVHRYKDAPANLDIYFVLIGKEFTPEDMGRARNSVSELRSYPNLKAIHESEFLLQLSQYAPLTVPNRFKGMGEL